MMFDDFCIEKILKGEKTVTRRVVRGERRPAVPGHIHKLKKNRTKECFGEILINSCSKSNLCDITNEDAKREGFENKEDFLLYFSKVNKLQNLNVYVWRVSFTLL